MVDDALRALERVSESDVGDMGGEEDDTTSPGERAALALNVLAVAVYLDADTHERVSRAFVDTDEVLAAAWHDAAFRREVPDFPSNGAVDERDAERIQAAERFLPALERLRGA